ncbi:MAG: EamA family transporter [Hyphomicrobiaceae bacterium]
MSRKDLTLALLVPIIWGFAFTLAKPATEHFPPLLMFSGVYAFVAVLYTLLFRGPMQTSFASGLVLGSLAGSLQAILIFAALARLDAAVSVIVLQTQVPISVLVDRLLNGTPVRPLQLIGIFIAFLGVAVIAGLPAEPPPLGPVALLLAGAAVWATGQALVRRIGRDPAPRLFGLIGLHAAPQLLVGSLLLETGQIDAILSATALQWGSALSLTLLGFGVGNVIWYSLMHRLRLAQMAPFLLLMPVVGVVISAVVLGEEVTIVQLAGGIIVLLGLALVLGIGQRGIANPKPRETT